MKFKLIMVAIFIGILFTSCDYTPTSDDVAKVQQEKILAEGSSEIGMPAITEFREKKMLKSILELRDKSSYITYSYLFSDMTGKFIFVGNTIGYPIPYSTQYTNPTKNGSDHYAYPYVINQADPNGLFSPSSSAGTWLMMISPNGKAIPAYFEPNVVCLPYKLPSEMLAYVPKGY